MFNAALFTSQDTDVNLVSIDRGMDTETGIWIDIYIDTHTQSNITQPEKEWNLDICSNMDGPWGYYGKSVREINTTWPYLICAIYKTKQQIKWKQT